MKHTKQFFLTHLKFRESLIFATPEQFESNYNLAHPWGIDAFLKYADTIKCWFEISDGRKTRSINLYSTTPTLLPERYVNLHFYCLYNGGLSKLSYQDLEYIYFFVRAYGKKYFG